MITIIVIVLKQLLLTFVSTRNSGCLVLEAKPPSGTAAELARGSAKHASLQHLKRLGLYWGYKLV